MLEHKSGVDRERLVEQKTHPVAGVVHYATCNSAVRVEDTDCGLDADVNPTLNSTFHVRSMGERTLFLQYNGRFRSTKSYTYI